MTASVKISVLEYRADIALCGFVRVDGVLEVRTASIIRAMTETVRTSETRSTPTKLDGVISQKGLIFIINCLLLF
jgi:hypothetical protein